MSTEITNSMPLIRRMRDSALIDSSRYEQFFLNENMNKDMIDKNPYTFDFISWVQNKNQQRLLYDFGIHYISYVKAKNNNGMNIGDVRVPFSILIKYHFKKIHDNFITERMTYDYI